MQRLFIMLMLAGLAVSCKQSAGNEAAGPAVEEKIEIVSATIPELLASPGEYQDKEVAISGMVTHVCRHGGQKCFVVAEDGETQLRIVPGGNIDEFKVELEGSTIAIKGVFRMLNTQQAEEHLEDHESQEHHDQEMAHSEAEKAEYYLEAIDLKQLNE